MQFTNEEMKMIALLRVQHESWRGIRVIILVASIVCATSAAWEVFANGFGTLPLLLAVVAAYGVSYTLGSWVGRPEVSLLLRLVEAKGQKN